MIYYFANKKAMKKFLEVLIDESGNMFFNSECDFHKSTSLSRRTEVGDSLCKAAIRGLVEQLWKNRNEECSFAIRILNIAEIISSPEPFKVTEDFWFSMMHTEIPRFEHFADGLKKPYGYDSSKIERPICLGPLFGTDLFGFPLDKNLS